MRFFKYLIIILFSSISLNALASELCTATVSGSPQYTRTGSTASAACSAMLSAIGHTFASVEPGTNKCLNIRGQSIGTVSCAQEPECWHPDYKIVQQSVDSQVKKSICIPNNGVMCKYTGNPSSNTVVNGYFTTTFSSVSKTPDPDCQEELVNPPCDPKDPYGGCYTPPNQECTRQFDGSIVCPEDKEPPIEKGCNGADYCKRPPQGCGDGYVSGTYNGERICIKSKPSSGDGSGDGSDGGGSDGGGSDGGGSDGGSGGGLPVTPDLTGVINAIKNLTSKIDHYFKETIESIDSMAKKITGKIDDSNVHLDQIESNTLATKNNTQTTNDLLEQIKDKIGSDSGSGENPPTGDGVDLTETNGLLREIRDGINDIKDVFSDEGKDALDQLGQASEDPRYLGALSNAESSLNTFANSLTLSSTACVSDMQIQIPVFGTVNIALSQWCSLLALLKILAHLSVLFACLRMLDSTVRAL